MSIRLMVVDDSKFVYNEMVFFLEGSDFELVKYCRSGEEAVEKVLQALKESREAAPIREPEK